MRLFNRNPWIEVHKELTTANVRQFGRTFDIECWLIFKVKLKKDGKSYKYKCYAKRVDGTYIQNFDLDYILEKDQGRLTQIIKEYNLI